jgi:hypothetical protein
LKECGTGAEALKEAAVVLIGVPETSDKSTTFSGTVLLHDPGGFAPTLKSVPAARHNMDVGMG